MPNEYTQQRRANLAPLHERPNKAVPRQSSLRDNAEFALAVAVVSAEHVHAGLSDTLNFMRGNGVAPGSRLQRIAGVLTLGAVGAGLVVGGQAWYDEFQDVNSPGSVFVNEVLKNEAETTRYADSVVPTRVGWVTQSLGGFLTDEAIVKMKLVGNNPERYTTEREELEAGFDALIAAGDMAASGVVDKDPVLEGQFTEQIARAVDSGLIDPALRDAPTSTKLAFADQIPKEIKGARDALIRGTANVQTRDTLPR